MFNVFDIEHSLLLLFIAEEIVIFVCKNLCITNRFVNGLLTLGMVIINSHFIIRIPHSGFWEWLECILLAIVTIETVVMFISILNSKRKPSSDNQSVNTDISLSEMSSKYNVKQFNMSELSKAQQVDDFNKNLALATRDDSDLYLLATSSLNLALHYEFGFGASRDLDKAKYWAQKAIDTNHEIGMYVGTKRLERINKKIYSESKSALGSFLDELSDFNDN